MKTELKIKIVAVAEEARIIRREERKYTLNDKVNKNANLQALRELILNMREIALRSPNPAQAAEAEERLLDLRVQYKAQRTALRAKYAKLRSHPKQVSLRNHRVNHLRPHARHTLLTYGFLRGRTYQEMENKLVTPLPQNRQSDQLDLLPSFDKVWDMLMRFNVGHGRTDSLVLAQRFAEWFDAAIAHLKSQGWNAAHITWKGVELGEPATSIQGKQPSAA